MSGTGAEYWLLTALDIVPMDHLYNNNILTKKIFVSTQKKLENTSVKNIVTAEQFHLIPHSPPRPFSENVANLEISDAKCIRSSDD